MANAVDKYAVPAEVDDFPLRAIELQKRMSARDPLADYWVSVAQPDVAVAVTTHTDFPAVEGVPRRAEPNRQHPRSVLPGLLAPPRQMIRSDRCHWTPFDPMRMVLSALAPLPIWSQR
ncbi:hypothetical protein A5640_08215 [Mycobacterium asiaticum]|uniref:Uncharacterized protein n=1 Tax=Mycobacterium asiaticum TaxID=1790 RepID=A0A1A3KPW3_MYCAS|nr:hypothetical protein A5640_08215 [Mycobacterium asiaticum]